MTDLICTRCGHHNPAHVTFCESCRAFLGWGQEEPEPGLVARNAGDAAGLPAPDDAVDGFFDPLMPSRATTPVREVDDRPPAPPPPVAVPPPEVTRPTPSVVTEAVPPPLPGTCPSCGNVNAPNLRFCSRCGFQFPVVATTSAASGASERLPWWKRLFGDDETRASRRAYRRTLSPVHRVLRVAGAVLAVVIAGAFLGIGGADPIGWGRDQWNKHRPDRYKSVDDVTALTYPPTADANDTAKFATDPDPTTSWDTPWNCATAPQDLCASALVVKFDKPTDLTRVGIGGGTQDTKRPPQYQPEKVQLVFFHSDGSDSTKEVSLKNEPTVVYTKVDEEDVTQVAVRPLEAYEPAATANPAVSIFDVQFSTHR